MKNLGHAVDISISNSKHREWALNDNSRTQLDSLQPEIEAIIYTKRSGEAFVTPLSESSVQVSEPSSSSFLIITEKVTTSISSIPSQIDDDAMTIIYCADVQEISHRRNEALQIVEAELPNIAWQEEEAALWRIKRKGRTRCFQKNMIKLSR